MTDLFDLSHFSAPLRASQAQLEGLRQLLLSSASEDQLTALKRELSQKHIQEFHRLLIGSPFAAEQLCKHPQWLLDIITTEYLKKNWGKQDYISWFQFDIDQPTRLWDQHLRQQRNKAMARIIWRDFNRLASTQDTTKELSFMAEAAVQATLDYHYRLLCTEQGIPLDEQGQQQSMIILGMGKLGAYELNLSSDIDLIFAYPNNGHTDKKALPNQTFFTRLGQRLIQSLDQTTADGFVFRVDMRLRPYGQSGALISSFSALEDYYQTQGREWERFAMIKARVIASIDTKNVKENVQSLSENLRGFTYRGYVDFSAIEALRDLKQRIQREVKRRRLQNNVKLGSGGIREVEFIAQAFQLIRGGRDKELQDRQLLNILPILRKLNCLPESVDQQLADAYLFLRNTEHAIQGYQDKQTQELPSTDEGLSRIAYVMGFDDSESFLSTLKNHRHIIQEQFEAVIAVSASTDTPDQQQELKQWQTLWQGFSTPATQSEELALEQSEELAELGIKPQTLSELINSPAVVAMDRVSEARLDQLMPILLSQLCRGNEPDDTLSRLTPLLVSIARRSAYLLLLIENPQALQQLLILSKASPWIARELAQHPALLDELLDPAQLYAVPSKRELEQELREAMLRVTEDDQEGQMEGLRYFRRAHSLRVAACEATERMPLMRVSDYLSELAEVICDYVLHLAWTEMIRRHGHPNNEINEEPNFIIVAYGKLGGIELGHNSDLDLVFIHKASSIGQTSGVPSTDGKSMDRSIDNHTFYTRLGQKIIHYLNTRTPAGQLYEVDMRLRPSGNSGLLTSSLSAYERYQLNDAWTWEHQALVRARAIAGCSSLAKAFEKVRNQILRQQRLLKTLRQDVNDMRDKMRKQLGSKEKQRLQGLFHLKQDAGGIVDIEFMVQYSVLAWSHKEPSLARYTDNIRILECLEETRLLSHEDAEALTTIYKTYRSKGHQLALQQNSSVISSSEFINERGKVSEIWNRLLSAGQD